MMNRFLALLMIFVPTWLFSQEKGIPISISVFNEATAIPFTTFFSTPVHPGVQIGTEFDYKNRGHSRWFQTVNVGYFYHEYLMQGIGINTELGREYRLQGGLAFSGLLGIGYMHTFGVAEEFAYTNGQYQKKPDKGNARLYPSLSLDMGYYFKKADAKSSKIFICYQSWVEYPYSPGFIPVMTHVNWHIGAKFFILTKEKQHG